MSVLKTISTKEEVIIPAYTCPTIAAAIIKSGLKPVLCDINVEDFSLLEDDLKTKINSNTLAIIQVELFGILPDNSRLRSIADKNDLFFVGDAAQSFGNYLNDKNLLNSQKYDFLIFSTGRGKPLNILNGGGLIVLKANFQKMNIDWKYIGDLTYSEKLKNLLGIILFKIFFYPRLYKIPKSLPFLKLGDTVFSLNININRFNNYLYNITNAVLKRYPQIFKSRLEKKELYHNIISKFSKHLFPIKIGNTNELIRFPVLFRERKTRDDMIQILEENGIGATGLYPHPLNTQPGLENYNLDFCSNASLIAEQILTLPIHEYVTNKDYEKLSYIFSKYFNSY